MLAVRTQTGLCTARQVASQIGRASALRASSAILTQRASLAVPRVLPQYGTTRPFSLTRDKIPRRDPPSLRTTKSMFPGPNYTEEELLGVQVGHRLPETFADKLALLFVRGARKMVDWGTGVKNDRPLTTDQYNTRILFLESIAAVPGMVAAVHRHLASLRGARRDQGWIKTLLEEAHNERMHLLTWMNLAEPGWMMRALIIAAQGVFFNICFVARWVSPTFFHRFVGYVEEEAIHTYTRLEQEIANGQIPAWSDPKFPVPEIAIEYWGIPKEKQTMLWLARYIRADEAGHRGVNHTLANLDQASDPNPFEPDSKHGDSIPNAVLRPQGFERYEVVPGVKGNGAGAPSETSAQA